MDDWTLAEVRYTTVIATLCARALGKADLLDAVAIETMHQALTQLQDRATVGDDFDLVEKLSRLLPPRPTAN